MRAGGLNANVEWQKRACLKVVEKVIPVMHKHVARAHVFSEFALADLAQGRYEQAWRGYTAAVASYPRVSILLRPPLAAMAGIAGWTL